MEHNKKRILLFADILEENFDGVSVTLHKILHAVPKDQFDFLIITAHPPLFPDQIPFEIFECSYLKVPFQKGYRLGIPKGEELHDKIRSFAPDLIHFTSPSLFARYAIKYGKKHQIPIMNIYHTHYPEYFKYYIGKWGDFLFGWFIKQAFLSFYRKSNITLVPTRSIKKSLLKLGLDRSKMKVWGRAIKADSFNVDYRKVDLFDLFIPEHHKKVLFVSRLIKEKEMDMLFKVYRHLRKMNKEVTMVITGDGPKRDWLEKKMPKAVFTGKKTGTQLSQIYASSDVFFIPSTSETFGNVVIEAMASGLPVVAADAGGPADLIRHKKNGYLVAPGKSKKFAKRICELVSDDELRHTMSKAAQKFVKSRSIESLHLQLWKIYHSTISDYKKLETANERWAMARTYVYKPIYVLKNLWR